MERLCAAIIPPGDNGNALRHWQYKHRSLPLRDLMFMEQTSCVILQISDVFSTVLICGRKGCGTVTYTNFLNRGGKVMAGHFVKEHGKPREGEEVYTKMSCPAFQTSNIQISKEHFVDYEDGEEEEKEQSPAFEQDDEELGSESLEVLGYKCGVVECGKVVLVSRFSTAMVALNRLKKHFSQIHRNLNSGQFIYETQYRDQVPSTIVSSDLATTRPHAIVYQCPATIKKGKPCQERMMDANALRSHWGIAHPTYAGKFEVILSEPVKSQPFAPLVPSPTTSQSSSMDEPPMIPVGRKPKQPTLEAQSCGHIGCDFASESKRDLARHRRDTGHSKLTGADGIDYICQEANCSHRASGIRGIEAHMEVDHPAIAEEDWAYSVATLATQVPQVQNASSSLKRPRESESASTQESPTAKKARVECDISANFDLTGLGEESTGDSDSDFDP